MKKYRFSRKVGRRFCVWKMRNAEWTYTVNPVQIGIECQYMSGGAGEQHGGNVGYIADGR